MGCYTGAVTHNDDVEVDFIGFRCFLTTLWRLGTPPSTSGDLLHLSEPDPSSLAVTDIAGRRQPLCDFHVVLVRVGWRLLSVMATWGHVFPDREGSLNRKLLELVDALKRHRVYITCFQENKWKGYNTREGNGYKLWYSGSRTTRNEVGIILEAYLKDKLVHMNRCNDRIISSTLVIDEGDH
ncbi:hypothetical protein Tco_1272767 [Tanacetum coccineum]